MRGYSRHRRPALICSYRLHATHACRCLAGRLSCQVAAHGGGHLRGLPEPAKVQKKKVHDAKQVRAGCGAEQRR